METAPVIQRRTALLSMLAAIPSTALLATDVGLLSKQELKTLIASAKTLQGPPTSCAALRVEASDERTDRQPLPVLRR